MKKAHKIAIGIAGAALATTVGIGIAAGDDFKVGTMASVSGILAEAETTEATAAPVESAEAVVSSDASNDGAALLAGADAVETVAQAEPEAEAPAVVNETEEVVTYNNVTYNAPVATVAPVVADAAPVAKAAPATAEAPAAAAPANEVKEAPAVPAAPAAENITDEDEKPEAEPSVTDEKIEDIVEERLGCASRECLLYTADGREVGSLFECYTCQDQYISDVDGNDVYSAFSLDDFISEDEAVALLEGDKDAIKGSVEEDYDEEGFGKVGCASYCAPVYNEAGELIGNHFHCSCGTDEITDLDGNVVFSREKAWDEPVISDEEVVALLEGDKEAIKGSVEEEVSEEEENCDDNPLGAVVYDYTEEREGGVFRRTIIYENGDCEVYSCYVEEADDEVLEYSVEEYVEDECEYLGP